MCRSTGSPRGLTGTDLEQLKPVMDAAHGHSLGAAALLVSASRLGADACPQALFSTEKARCLGIMRWRQLIRGRAGALPAKHAESDLAVYSGE